MEMEWCPQHAMNAYLKTLRLRKIYGSQASNNTLGSPRFYEPKIMEFLSALAAGNGAKLIVQITSQGVSPITLALAVAAKQTGGRFICIIPDDNDDKEDINRSSSYIYQQINDYDHHHLTDVIQFVAGNPCEIVIQQKNIDFIVIDSQFRDHELNLLKAADFNPKGSVIVTTNRFNGRKRESFGEIVKIKNGVYCDSVTLPVGEGIELTKILPCKKYDRRKCTRFHVTYEY